MLPVEGSGISSRPESAPASSCGGSPSPPLSPCALMTSCAASSVGDRGRVLRGATGSAIVVSLCLRAGDGARISRGWRTCCGRCGLGSSYAVSAGRRSFVRVGIRCSPPAVRGDPVPGAAGARCPRAVGMSVRVWGPGAVPLACMPCGGCVLRGWWGAVPGGGGLPPLRGASGVMRCPSPSRPSSGAGSRGSATRVSRVRSVWAWGPGTQHRPHIVRPCGPALLAAVVAEVRPRGDAFHCCGGRLRSGAPPPPTARPPGGLLRSATHVLWARVCRCGGPALFPWLARPAGAVCRGVGGGPSPGGVARHRCEGRLVSGVPSLPTARPLGGLLGSATHVLWARVCGCGGPALSPWPACPVGAAYCGGGGGPSPGGGGLPPLRGASGVMRCPSPSRPSSRAGSRGSATRVSRVRSVWAWGPSTQHRPHIVRPCGPALLAAVVAEVRPRGDAFHCCGGRLRSGAPPPPTARPPGGLLGSATHVLWARVCKCGGPALFPWLARPAGAACRGVGGGPSPGGVARHRCEGRLVSGVPSLPTARPLGGLLGSATHVLWARVCGCGGPALSPWPACPGGGGLLPLRGASGVRRCPSPSRLSSGAGGRGSATCVSRVRSVRALGPSTGPTACAFAGRRCPLRWWRKGVSGGGASHSCEGRLMSGAPPPPTASPLGGLLGSATHVLWARAYGCGGPTLSPWPACPLRAACRGGGGGPSPGRVVCHRCEGRLVSGAVPPPAARPLGRAAGVPRPMCPGCGRCGRGDPAPAPQRAGVARCGGGGGASPGGVPSTVMRGV